MRPVFSLNSRTRVRLRGISVVEVSSIVSTYRPLIMGTIFRTWESLTRKEGCGVKRTSGTLIHRFTVASYI